MGSFVAMLRGINVSGQKRILMADLKRLCETLEFENVVTYLQSGNVVFTSSEPEPDHLARLLEGGLVRMFGFPVTVIIRTPADLRQIIETNPFLVDRKEDPAKLYVTFLHHPVPENSAKPGPPPPGGDEMILGEREVFLFCPGGYGSTKFSNAYFESKLKQPATTRNWNTVMALGQLCRQD